MRRIHARAGLAARVNLGGGEPMHPMHIYNHPNSLPWALAPISALAPFTGGVFRLENTKENQADVRPPCEKTTFYYL